MPFSPPRPMRPAQLMQLREAEALGVLDHHHGRIRHVHADFDHRRRHQNVDFAPAESFHDVFFFLAFHAAVQQADLPIRENHVFCRRSYSTMAAFSERCDSADFDCSITG